MAELEAPQPELQPEAEPGAKEPRAPPVWKPADLQDPIWQSAPRCMGLPDDRAQVTKDTVGRLWGWQKGISCAFKTRDNEPLVADDPHIGDAWDGAPPCEGNATGPNSVSDSFGRLWGWEDGNSCAFRGKRWQNWLSQAPVCSGPPNDYNSVRDSWGRLWGWDSGMSCRFA